MYENININNLPLSNCNILVQEFDCSNLKIKKIIEGNKVYDMVCNILKNISIYFNVKYFTILYSKKYNDWRDSLLSDYDFLNGAEINNKKFEIINNNEEIFYMKKVIEEYGAKKLVDLIYDRIEFKIGGIIFIHISDEVIIYPHDDFGFGIIDLGNNINLVKQIIDCFNEYPSNYFNIGHGIFKN